MVSTTHPTRYWHRLDDGRIQCDVCPRACKLREGQQGVCFVRGREGDQVVLRTYGRSSGFCIDPIEKKPLAHVLPGSATFSFGTAGCNLACRFCQNWDISKSKEIDTLAQEASPAEIAAAALAGGCRSVAFTYNDPTVFLEYAVDTAIAAHEAGLRTVAVTAGSICPEPRAELFGHIDAANVDLKGFDEDFYRHTCGAELRDVLDTLVWLRDTDVWVELTTLLIPGRNDDEGDLDAMTRWVVSELGPDVPMHFTAFHPDYRLLDAPPTPTATLVRARQIAEANGVRFAYTGNVADDPDGSRTRCPGCGQVVMERTGYAVTAYALDDGGRCQACSTQLPGVFDGPAGGWGERRQPVTVHRARRWWR